MTAPSGDVKPTLIAPSGNRYTIATEAEAISRARTLNAGPAADALAEAVGLLTGHATTEAGEEYQQVWTEDLDRARAALDAYRKASEEPK